MTLPIQDEPESTVGRKPDRFEHPERTAKAPSRPGAIRREEGDETAAGAERREGDHDATTERELDE
ncbi:hypothetical protein [Anaeromyxobacter oryzisoli]|jgi:hypothetical protein|uniref:hypothetical protein n=1 Tax=Anaeromyxobacter oryzisoli TaxID=2925408 RepID=UPI001F585C2E|nr:hypothetical protein [Anaeromyxobacter sp. SG63]